MKATITFFLITFQIIIGLSQDSTTNGIAIGESGDMIYSEDESKFIVTREPMVYKLIKRSGIKDSR